MLKLDLCPVHQLDFFNTSLITSLFASPPSPFTPVYADFIIRGLTPSTHIKKQPWFPVLIRRHLISSISATHATYRIEVSIKILYSTNAINQHYYSNIMLRLFFFNFSKSTNAIIVNTHSVEIVRSSLFVFSNI